MFVLILVNKKDRERDLVGEGTAVVPHSVIVNFFVVLGIMWIVLNFLCGCVCEGEEITYIGSAVRYYGVLME